MFFIELPMLTRRKAIEYCGRNKSMQTFVKTIEIVVNIVNVVNYDLYG